jgi:hypothetical protein
VLEDVRQTGEQLVSVLVPPGVVVLLEVVDVDHGQ